MRGQALGTYSDRLALELTDRQATALTIAIRDTSTIPPEVAQLQGIALAGVSGGFGRVPD